MKKPDLYLINGPLGAGKTTFLRHVLTQPEFINTRVIENEFASVSIDTTMLHDHTAEVQTIAGVCICCSSGDELVEALMSLAGSTAPVIIEATGVANSLQLVEKLVLGDVLDHYHLAHAVFVLDAAEVNEQQLADYTDELRAADTVLVSKCDLVEEAEKHNLFRVLRDIGVAKVLSVVDGVVELGFLNEPSNIVEFFAETNGDITMHDTGTNYTILTLPLPVDPHELEQAWHRLTKTYSLRRMKGDIADRTGNYWHIEATPAQFRAAQSGVANQTQLVCIGGSARELTLRKFEEAF